MADEIRYAIQLVNHKTFINLELDGFSFAKMIDTSKDS